MRPVETRISAFLLSRPASVLMMAIALCAAISTHGHIDVTPYTADDGFLFPSLNSLITNPYVSFIVGLALTAVILTQMETLNRVFNILRAPTLLFLGVFAIMQMATPMTVTSVTSGLVLNVVVLGVLATFYTCYQRPRYTRRVFLAFFILSALSLADYIYAIYILLFLLGFSQMRCGSGRMWLAALMGIATPWWMAWGFGLMDGIGPHWPDGESIFRSMDKPHLVLTVVTVGITVIGQFLLCVSNMLKVYSYNARSRSLSGLLMMLSLATALAALLDFANAPAYLSLLNCFTAFQIALFTLIRRQRRGYLLIVATIVVYSIIFCVNLWIS